MNLKEALKNLFLLPNWENRIGDYDDIKDAVKELHQAYLDDQLHPQRPQNLLEIWTKTSDPIKWAAMEMTKVATPGMTVGEAMDAVEKIIREAVTKVTADLVEQRDELQSALCVARVNAKTHCKMTTREFAVLCGRSATWVSRWTSTDCGGPPDLIETARECQK